MEAVYRLVVKMADSLSTGKAKKANAAVYENKSLKGRSDKIRLLHASRNGLNRSGWRMTWTLEDYKLQTASRIPYTALSYSWGSANLSRSIVLNGIKFRIPKSVFAILEEIRTNSELSPTNDSWW